MNLQNSNFTYTVVLKKEQGINSAAFDQFASMSEISFKSREFKAYAECVRSCKTMMETMTVGINERESENTFKVGAEVNPVVTGSETLSKDWGDDEVARFWIYNRAMEGSKIDAVARGSLFAVERFDSGSLMN